MAETLAFGSKTLSSSKELKKVSEIKNNKLKHYSETFIAYKFEVSTLVNKIVPSRKIT